MSEPPFPGTLSSIAQEPQRCQHGVEMSMGCWECAKLGRELAFKLALGDMVKGVRFGGYEPYPRCDEYARVALSQGFDLYWCADWIRSGYPRPPPWVSRVASRVAIVREACEHGRQVTQDGDLLPCAYPECRAGLVSKGFHWWRTVRPPRPLLRFNAEGATRSFKPEVVEWTRLEHKGPRGRGWVWVQIV